MSLAPEYLAASQSLLAAARPLLLAATRLDIRTALDVGCGLGLHAEYLCQAGIRVTACDLVLRPECRQIVEAAGGEAHEGSWTDFWGREFDAVYSHCCLEHIPAPLDALRGWAALVRPGGYLLLGVPKPRQCATSGHLFAGWNVAHLCHLLALTGWDCRDGRFYSAAAPHGNVYAIARAAAVQPPPFAWQQAPLAVLRPLLPAALDWRGDGYFTAPARINWPEDAQ